ncbi:MAG: hypothetical protein E4H02_02770 [Lentisphaerales bacterium]|jgi:hypothetical protein|nr:MAG: hypothetical protein E4H02_02770 [Lentisphaerales bacterium]
MSRKWTAIQVGTVLAMLAVPLFAQDMRTEMAVKLNSLLPSDTDSWDSAANLEIQTRFWGDSQLGAAVSIGFGTWVARSEYVEEEDEIGFYSSAIYGNVSEVPVGVSALFRTRVNPTVSLVFEAGIRYVFIDSSITVEIAEGDDAGSSYSRERIDMDNAVQGVVGLGIEGMIDESIRVFGGLDCRFDIVESHERFLGEDLGPTSLRAVSANIGVAWAF